MTTVVTPQVRAREATKAETPRSAAALLALARGNGWWATATYAQGVVIPRRGPLAHQQVDIQSLVVRVSLDAAGHARGVAIWTDGKFDIAFRYSDWLWTEKVGFRLLCQWVSAVSALMVPDEEEEDTS